MKKMLSVLAGLCLGVLGAADAGATAAKVLRGTTVLSVDFSQVKGNDSSQISTSSGVFAGWTAATVFAATNEVRFSSGSGAGSLTTPALDAPGNVTVRFKARLYGSDSAAATVGVSTDGGAHWDEAPFTPATAVTEFEESFEGGPSVLVRWSSEKKRRFYISSIVVEAGEAADPDLNMPAEVNFGATALGAAVTQAVAVVNRGATSNLVVSSFAAVSGDTAMFSVTAPPATLAPGASATLRATYRPTAAGMHSATWVLRSNDPGEPAHEIVFAGRTPDAAMTVSNIQYTTSPNGSSPYAGQTVTVRGIMTYLDANGWCVSDPAGGPWSGVYVAEKYAWPELGDDVTFSATVSESTNETRLSNVTDLCVLSHGNEVPPADVAAAALTNECWEGVLVRVDGATVVNANVGNKGTHWQVKDSAGKAYNVLSRVPLRECWSSTSKYSSVTGVVVPLNGTNGVSPRYDADIGGRAVQDFALCGTVVTPDGPRDDTWVHVVDDVILSVGTARPDAAIALDLRDRGAIIFPGLIDAHNHIGYSDFPTLAFNNYPFGHRDEWGESDSEYTAWKNKRTSLRSSIGDSTKDIITKYGECLELMAGCVVVQGESNTDIEHGYPPVILRNIELFPFRTSQDIFPWDSSASERDTWKRKLAGGALDALMIHLCEGTDTVAHAQFGTWKNWGMLTNGVTIIHGAALTPSDFAEMAAAGACLVWSPMSNMRLYAGTADIVAAKDAGVTIGLSPDWTPSGCFNILEELGCAWDLNRTRFGNAFTAKELCDMVTWNTAVCSGIEDTHGAIAPGRNAGLAVIEGDPAEPYLSLIAARPGQVLLTVVDGTPRYGDSDLMAALGAGDGRDSILFRGRRKTFNVAVKHPYLEYSATAFTNMVDVLTDGHAALAPTGELDLDELQFLAPGLLQGDGDDVAPFRADSPLSSAPSTTVTFDTGSSLSLAFRYQDFWDNATFTEDLRHTIDIVPAKYPQYSVQTIARDLPNRKENQSVAAQVAFVDMHTNYLFRFTTTDGAGNSRVTVTTNGFKVKARPGGDTDGDGLPNEWEIEYFGVFDGADAASDPDADGAANREEYIADTSPLDSASRFGEIASASADGEAVRIALDGWTSTGRVYDIWWTPSLTEPDWRPLGLSSRGRGDSTGLTFSIPQTNGPALFYRAGVALPQED